MTTFLLPTDPIVSIDAYLANGIAGAGIRRGALRAGSAGHDRSRGARGLRGRGGGGFPTGQKWAGVAAQVGGRRASVCNGAEGEPGTFKDRALLRANPYQLVEGVAIAVFAIDAGGGVHLPEGELPARDRGGHPCRAGVPDGGVVWRLQGHHRGRAGRVPVR